MIPKIIHYCWFGGKPKPENIERYLQTWKDELADYHFIEWNESNFDVQGSIPYVREAYEAKKYAFVSDYVRLHALCEYGGVYLDTDIELIKDFSEFLKDTDVLLCYESKNLLCTAFMASASGNPLIEGFKDTYTDRRFKLSDGTLNTATINQSFTDYLAAQGIVIDERNHREPGDIAIYSSDYFSAQDINHGHPNITENTCAVHWFECSWGVKQTGLSKVQMILKYQIVRPFAQKILGYRTADALMDWIRGKQRYIT